MDDFVKVDVPMKEDSNISEDTDEEDTMICTPLTAKKACMDLRGIQTPTHIADARNKLVNKVHHIRPNLRLLFIAPVRWSKRIQNNEMKRKLSDSLVKRNNQHKVDQTKLKEKVLNKNEQKLLECHMEGGKLTKRKPPKEEVASADSPVF